jgi:hypothetical protein
MLYLALAFCIVMPILGVAEMENGAVSPFIAEPGSPNGATAAYFVHILSFFIAFFWIIRRNVVHAPHQVASQRAALSSSRIDLYMYFCALLFAAFALLLIFGFGAINILTLTVDKAEFRVGLGTFGAIIPLATKWYMPALFAILMRICIDYGWTRKRIALAVIACLSLVFFGMATGFKTTVIQMLLPAFIVCSWKITPRLALIGALLVGSSVIGLAIMFDGHGSLDAALDAIWYRMTVLQSDLTWYTWEVARSGGELPKYLRTFFPILGDPILRIVFSVNPDKNFTEWASYYYGSAMTLFGGYPEQGVLAGVNNQATLFAESVIIGGVYFFPLVSFFFGLFVGKITTQLRSAIVFRRYAQAGTLSCLFSFTVLMWTLGNGLSSFLYLINIFGFLTTYLIIHTMLRNERLSKVSVKIEN